MLLLVSSASAQSTTEGAIGGLVSDPMQAAVPGATVVVRNVATNAQSETISDANGRFLIIRLPPGVYAVEASISGFSTFKTPNVIVEVGRSTNLDIRLSIAAAAEVVEVAATAPVINTEQHDFSTNINQTQIANLPTNTRRWSTFALSTPGAAPDGNFGLVSFRGISGLLNSNSVDGADNVQAFFSEERGRTRLAYSVSLDAIQEFQVSTSNYSAEYGRAAGGAVNAVTKSGTNAFHGSGFYFIRDNEWGATNPFQTQTQLINGVATQVQLKPEDRRQQFGFTVGGPIRRDRLFFFFSFDQQLRKFPGVAAPSNPTDFFAPFTDAELTTLAGRGITPAQGNEGLAFLQSTLGVLDRTGDQTLFLPKVDWKITNNHTLSGTYNRLRWESPGGVQTAAVVNRGLDNWGDDGVHEDWTTERLTSVFGNRMTNEVRFQWGRDYEFQTASSALPGSPTSSLASTPATQIQGTAGLTFGKPDFLDRRGYPDERRVDIGDTFTLFQSSHLLKFGGNVSRVHDILDNLFQESGAYVYSNRVNFITDYTLRDTGPARNFASYNQGIGPTAFEFTTYDLDFFVQDTWHATSQLTVNLGLRYDYQKLPDPQIPNPALPATAVFPSDKNNWGPRIGAAYDLTGRGKTVVRGGYGIFYGRIINSTISNAITNVGSTSGQIQVQYTPTTAAAPTWPNVVSGATGTITTPPDVIVFRDDTQNPMIHQYDAIFEHEIAPNTVVSASYVGSKGKYLPLFVDTNLPDPSGNISYAVSGGPYDGQSITMPYFTGPRPNTSFGRITEISNVVDSTYNALVLSVNRRLTKGLQVQANYTEARATDGGQSTQTFTSANNVVNPKDLSLEDGRSNFEVRHRFVANAIWMTEFGEEGTTWNKILSDFTVAPTFGATSGLPYTGLLNGNGPTTVSGLTGNRISTGALGAGGTNRLPGVERNTYAMPKTWNFDLRIARSFGVGNGQRIEGMVDIFNVTNRMNYTQVNNTLYNVSGQSLNYNTTFGTLTNGNSNYFVFTPRQVQLSVRYTF